MRSFLATCVLASSLAFAQGPPPWSHGSGSGANNPPLPSAPTANQFQDLTKALNLTTAQVNALVAALTTLRTQEQNLLNTQLRPAEQAMQQALAAATPNGAAIVTALNNVRVAQTSLENLRKSAQATILASLNLTAAQKTALQNLQAALALQPAVREGIDANLLTSSTSAGSNGRAYGHFSGRSRGGWTAPRAAHSEFEQ